MEKNTVDLWITVENLKHEKTCKVIHSVPPLLKRNTKFFIVKKKQTLKLS